jgi:putative oxidoreductase
MFSLLKLKFLGRFRDLGLLIIRVGIGISFVVHGSGKMFNPDRWGAIGGAMGNFGVTFAPAFWGFMAAFSEFGGGILFLLGFFFRPAAALMAFTMLVAMTMHIAKGDDFGGYSHAMELGILFFGMMLVGPGRLSIDGE